MSELDPNRAPEADDANYKRVVENLGKLDKKSRPRKRKTLAQHILSIFQNKIKQQEVDRIVDKLFANKMVTETNKALTYKF